MNLATDPARRAVAGPLANRRHRAVNVAMPAMRMVQVPVHQIVHMVAVRNAFVAATGGVDVRLRVCRAGVARRALRRVRHAHRQRVFIHMAGVDVMQVPIVEVVDVAVVRHGEMTTTRPVGVRMGGVLMVVRATGGPEGAGEQREPAGELHGIAFVGLGDASVHRGRHASGRCAWAARRCSASYLQLDSLLVARVTVSLQAS